ncbi:hypothetical protein ACMD2_22024 [Ananas comosus]|uniref:Uncharacterized protein n=1 Tax=Ananas comosus TaxID=4615 RepID=A0A199W788_ANACO|nr:hypothetical protein ACMD2_22024 [Ananas comosus]
MRYGWIQWSTWPLQFCKTAAMSLVIHPISLEVKDEEILVESEPSNFGSLSLSHNIIHIPPHVAITPYYRSIIAIIQKEGLGVEPPMPYEISGKYLDAEVNDIHAWVKNFKQQWGDVVFHKSIDATSRFEDSDYIYALLEQVLREVGEKCVINRVKKTVDTAQRISKYLYNYFWVHALIMKFTGQELVRPDITRFATNFIALYSILQNKNELKSMFASDEWQTLDEKSIEQIILPPKFWDYVKEINDIVEPLYMVLRLRDKKKNLIWDMSIIN